MVTATRTPDNIIHIPAAKPRLVGPTSRWYPLKSHAVQHALATSTARFVLSHAGRRSGKTEIKGKRRLVYNSLVRQAVPDAYRVCAAPTHAQAKRIFWRDLKSLIPRSFMANNPSESELMITLKNGARIQVAGLDKPERFEGIAIDEIVIDEFGNTKADVWEQHIRPALSTPGRPPGRASLLGVPEGRNHFYRLVNRALADIQEGSGVYGVYHWNSADILDPEEITQARKDLDPLAFAQEYEGSFINFQGRAYYNFNRELHTGPVKYDPNLDLIFCFDFNVDPGVAVICQEQYHPSDGKPTERTERITAVIDEVWIPRNSNTPAVCKKLVQTYHNHDNRVFCYGDATGGARGTAQVQGSDWDLIKEALGKVFKHRLKIRVPKANPRERARVNALNSRLKGGDGKVRMIINGEKCPHLCDDLDGVIVLEGGSGELDKKHDKMLSHLCLAGDTLVDTDSGMIKISDIPQKGKIRAHHGGYVGYVEAGIAGINRKMVQVTFDDGTSLRCTPDHIFLTSHGWEQAISLQGKECFSWQTFKYFRKRHTDLMDDILSADRIDYIGLCMNQHMEKFQRECASTTKTKTCLTIPSQTSKCLHHLNTRFCTCKHQNENKCLQDVLKSLRGLPQTNGMEVMRAELGIKNSMQRYLAHSMRNDTRAHVDTVEKNTKQVGKINQGFALKIAKHLSAENQVSMTRRDIANVAVKITHAINIHIESSARSVVLQNTLVNSVEHVGTGNTYCLRVPSTGCFALANGIIVGNSDAAGYYTDYKFPAGGSRKKITVTQT